jgi:hypothetical protein
VVAPIERVVAALAKFTVVAVVLIRSNEVLGVVKDVVIAGLVPNTNAPDPVSSVTAARRLAEDGVPRKVATPVPNPDTPVAIGRPVALVSVALLGVPNAGVINVGLVVNATVLLPLSSVRADARLALEGVAKNVATPVPRPDTPVSIGRPVQLVSVPDAGVPRAGVVRVGLVSVLLVRVWVAARDTSSNPPAVVPS